MLTPAFELRQDKDFLTVILKAPFAKVAETEIFIEEDDFKFYSKPYFLRLTLPGNIVEDGREKADYNVDNGEFTIVVPKETPGEHFEGLDMLTKLLEPKGAKPKASPLIEVLDENTNCATPDNTEDEDFDWCIEQVPYTEQPSLIGAPKYGFANQKSGVFARLQEDMVYIVDCSDPDGMSAGERRDERIQAETSKFDQDHYLGDMLDDIQIKQIVDFRPQWIDEVDLVKAGTPVDMTVELSEDEREVLRKLPRKEYVLEPDEETCVFLGLVDILFAYCYDHRTTEGENNCESGWTICKVSSTLSCLEVFSSLEDVLKSCYRRCLCYPLYRNWKLNQALQNDVAHILSLGRKSILKRLLEIRQILTDQDCRYVLNDLYITDYCVWIQSVSEKRFQSLADAVHKIKVSKADLGLDIPELEEMALHAINQEQEDEICDLTEKMGIQVNKSEETDTESDESDTESDCSDTDSDDIVSDEDEVRGTGDIAKNKVESDKVKGTCDIAKNKVESDIVKGTGIIGKNNLESDQNKWNRTDYSGNNVESDTEKLVGTDVIGGAENNKHTDDRLPVRLECGNVIPFETNEHVERSVDGQYCDKKTDSVQNDTCTIENDLGIGRQLTKKTPLIQELKPS